MKTLAITLGFLGCAALFGCGVPSLDREDDGSKSSFEVGTSFEVRLDENGSTGIAWEPGSWDRSIVALLGDDYTSSSDATGAGGIRTFELECVKAGTVELSFNEVSPAGETLPQSAHFTVTCTP